MTVKAYLYVFSALATPQSIVWKKKVYLVNCIWRGHIEFGARDLFWRRTTDLP